jgi:hypothetical protein
MPIANSSQWIAPYRKDDACAELRQTDVGGHEWELTGLELNMTRGR